MAYLKKWRSIQARVTELAQSSDEHDEHDNQLNQVAQTNCSDAEAIQTNTEDVCISPAASHGQQTSSASESDYYSSDHDFVWDDSFENMSSSTSSDSGHVEVKPNLSVSLAAWVVKYNVPREGTNALLDIFRQHGHRMPADSRTLLQTPQTCDVEDKCGGKYLYFGLKSGILKILAQNPAFCKANDTVRLHVNIDGIPIFKSTNEQMWPILCSFSDFPPFIVALYSGNSKPNNIAHYVENFLNEYIHLQQEHIYFEDKQFHICVRVFICDAPARAFIKCIIGHTGYYSCERCTMKGTWKGRVVFNSIEFESLRTDEQFNEQVYEHHQKGKSPLIDTGIQSIKCFCLDYMHLVCLGVTKRILTYLKAGPKVCKLSFRHISEISECLQSFSGKMPADFARQPRTMIEMERWKATEFRQFLLYTGSIALKKVLSPKMYEHFLSLMVAVSILLMSDDERRNYYVPYARQLLSYFVDNCKEYYGKTFTVYNVHNLLHLADDVETFQSSLNEISAFKFENHLQSIKKLVKSAHNPVVQVGKRIRELEKANTRISCNKQRTYISSRMRDSCFLLRNNEYAFVKEKQEKGFVCDVLKEQYTQSFFKKPCDSKMLNIVYIKNLRDNTRRKLLERKDLRRKVICLDYNQGYVLFPMLHEVETLTVS